MKRRIIVKYRRTREGKTDYRLRLKLLLSHKPRLVIRKSNNNMICQIIEYDQKGDRVIASAHSSELKKMGWTKGTGNTTAAYFTGALAAKKAIKKGVKEGVVDFGLQEVVKGSRLYAALKGAYDAGFKIKIGDGVLPSEDRIAGAHNKIDRNEFESFKKKIIS